MRTALLQWQQLEGQKSQFSDVRNRRNMLHTLVRMNVFIMVTLLCLGARSIYWPIRECFTFFKARGNLDSMDSTRLLVLLPCRSSNISANNGLDRKDLEFAHLHASILEQRAERFRDLGREVESKEMRAQGRDSFG